MKYSGSLFSEFHDFLENFSIFLILSNSKKFSKIENI